MRADVSITRKLFTVDDYHRMADAGVFEPEERVELIEGEIIKMSPIGHKHMVAVNRATDSLTGALRRKAIVSIQNPLRLNNYNEPQPDIVVFKWRPDFYAAKPYTLEDALLVLEMSDATVAYDTKVKVPLYAKTGVPEVWIVNLRSNAILGFRDPSGNTYKTHSTFRSGHTIAALAFPDVVFPVEDFLGS